MKIEKKKLEEYYGYLYMMLGSNILSLDFSILVPKWIDEGKTKENCFTLCQIEIEKTKFLNMYFLNKKLESEIESKKNSYELCKLGVISSEIMPGLLENIVKKKRNKKKKRIKVLEISLSIAIVIIIGILYICIKQNLIIDKITQL